MKSLVIRLIIAFTIIAALIYNVGYQEIIESVITSDAGLIAISTLFVVPAVFLRLVRWHQILNDTKAGIGFIESSRVYLMGIFFGTVTPGKIGDFSKFYFLKKKYRMSAVTALSTSMVDRWFDVLAVFLISFVGIALIPHVSGSFAVYLIPLFFVFTTMTFLVLHKRTCMNMMKFSMTNLKPVLKMVKLKIGYSTAAKNFYAPIGRLKKEPSRLVLLVSMTIGTWMFLSLHAQFILSSMGFDVGLQSMMPFMAIAAIVSLIPISISGVGIREVSLIALLNLVGVPAAEAISMSILYFFFSQVVPALIGGALYASFKTK